MAELPESPGGGTGLIPITDYDFYGTKPISVDVTFPKDPTPGNLSQMSRIIQGWRDYRERVAIWEDIDRRYSERVSQLSYQLLYEQYGERFAQQALQREAFYAESLRRAKEAREQNLEDLQTEAEQRLLIWALENPVEADELRRYGEKSNTLWGNLAAALRDGKGKRSREISRKIVKYYDKKGFSFPGEIERYETAFAIAYPEENQRYLEAAFQAYRQAEARLSQEARKEGFATGILTLFGFHMGGQILSRYRLIRDLDPLYWAPDSRTSFLGSAELFETISEKQTKKPGGGGFYKAAGPIGAILAGMAAYLTKKRQMVSVWVYEEDFLPYIDELYEETMPVPVTTKIPGLADVKTKRDGSTLTLEMSPPTKRPVERKRRGNQWLAPFKKYPADFYEAPSIPVRAKPKMSDRLYSRSIPPVVMNLSWVPETQTLVLKRKIITNPRVALREPTRRRKDVKPGYMLGYLGGLKAAGMALGSVTEVLDFTYALLSSISVRVGGNWYTLDQAGLTGAIPLGMTADNWRWDMQLFLDNLATQEAVDKAVGRSKRFEKEILQGTRASDFFGSPLTWYNRGT